MIGWKFVNPGKIRNTPVSDSFAPNLALNPDPVFTSESSLFVIHSVRWFGLGLSLRAGWTG